MKLFVGPALVVLVLLFTDGVAGKEADWLFGAWRVEFQGMENPGVTGVGRALFFEPIVAVSDGKYTGALELRTTLLRGNEVYRYYRAVAMVTNQSVVITLTNAWNGFIWKIKGKLQDGRKIQGLSRDQLNRGGWVTFTPIPLDEGGGHTPAPDGLTSSAVTVGER